MKRPLKPLAALAATAALAAALSACGSDGGAGARASAQRVIAVPSVDAKTAAEARKRGFFNEAQPPGGSAAGESAAARAARPCTLVSSADARAAFGAAVRKPIEAQQGPTCIYRTRSGKGFLTLAVQSLQLKQLRPLLKNMRKVPVSGRTGYCGETSQSTLYVPLPGGRMLTVGGIAARRVPGAARCGLPRAFAAKAIPQLST